MLSGGVREVAVRLTLEAADFARESGLIRQGVTELAGQFESVDKAIDRTRNTLAGTSASLAALGAFSTNTAVQWQTSFAGVEKTVAGTSEQLDEVGASIREVARESPVGADQLAGLASMAGQLGVTTSAVDEYAETAAMLGSATELGADQAIFQLSRFIGVIGDSEQSIDNYGAALTHLGNTSKTTEGSILDFAQNIAGTANTVGVAGADVLGIATAFSSAGIEAEAGGTAIQKVMLQINQAATIGGSKLSMFADTLGMTRDEFQKLARDNPTEAFIRFVEKLTSEGEMANATLVRLGLNDQRLVRSFLNVANAGESVRQSVERANGSFEEGTALAEEYGTRNKTVASQMQILANVGQEIRRSIGETFVPALGLAVSSATKFLDLYNKLPGVLKGSVAVFGGLAMGATAAGAAMLHLGQSVGMTAFGLQLLARTQVGMMVLGVIKTQAAAAAVALARLAGAHGIEGVANALKYLAGNKLGFFKTLAGMSFTGLKALPGVLWGASKATAAWVAALDPAVLIVGALGAAVGAYALQQKIMEDRLRTSSEAAKEYAEAMGIAYSTLNTLSTEEDDQRDPDAAFSNDMAGQIQQVKALRQELRDPMILQWAMELRAGGASPEEVQEYVDRLRDATGTTYTLEFDDRDLDDINTKLQLMETNLGQVTKALSGMTVEERTLRALGDGIKTLFDFDHRPTALTADQLERLNTQALALARSMEDGAVGTAEALVQVDKFGETLKGLSSSEAKDYVTQFFEALENTEGFNYELDTKELGRAGAKGADEMYNEFARQVKANFSESVLPKGLDLTDEKAVIDWLNTQREGFEESGKAISDQTRLMQYLGEEYANAEKADQKRLLGYKTRQMAEMYGIETTIDMLNEEIAKREEVGDVANEVFQALEQEREKLLDQLWNKQESELDGLIESVSPVQAMRAINEAIQELDAGSEKYYDRLDALQRKQDQLLKSAQDNLVRLVEQEQTLIDQRSEIRADAADRIMEIERQAKRDEVEAVESRNEALADAARSHAQDLKDAEMDRAENLSQARERLDEELKGINDTYKQRLREQGEELANWASLTERIFTEASMSPDALILNIEQQQKQFEDWQRGLATLRKKGLSNKAIDMLGLEESPRMLGQVEQLTRASAGQLDKINQMVATRRARAMKVAKKNNSEALQEAKEARRAAYEEYRESVRDIQAEFRKHTAKINKDYQESLAEIHRKHTKAMADLHEKTRRSINQVNRDMKDDLRENAEEMRKIGQKSGTDYGEAVRKGMNSKNRAIREAAREVKRLMKEQAQGAADGVQNIMAKSIRQVEKEVDNWTHVTVKGANRVLRAIGHKPLKVSSGRSAIAGGSRSFTPGGGRPGVFQSGGRPQERFQAHMAERPTGRISGNGTGDIVPALLEPHEYVMPRAAVNYYGTNFMEQIRDKRFDVRSSLTPEAQTSVADTSGLQSAVDGYLARAAGGVRKLHAGGPVDPAAPPAVQRQQQQLASQAQGSTANLRKTLQTTMRQAAGLPAAPEQPASGVAGPPGRPGGPGEHDRSPTPVPGLPGLPGAPGAPGEPPTAIKMPEIDFTGLISRQEPRRGHSGRDGRDGRGGRGGHGHVGRDGRDGRDERSTRPARQARQPHRARWDREESRSGRDGRDGRGGSGGGGGLSGHPGHHGQAGRGGQGGQGGQGGRDGAKGPADRVMAQVAQARTRADKAQGPMGPMASGKSKERKDQPSPFERFEPRKMAKGGIVQLGRQIENMGYDVGEHPSFGGVAPVHTANSWHYKAAALDINWYPVDEERAKLNSLANWIRSRIAPRELFWPGYDPVGGHGGHLHVAWPGGGEVGPGMMGGAPPVPDLSSRFGKIGMATEEVLNYVAAAFNEEMAKRGMLIEGLEEYTGSSGKLKRMVKSLAKRQEGWGDNQWPALNRLVQKESSWNPNAQNPTSTAYGLFQFLNSTWATVGATKTSDPFRQAQAGLQYVDQRYGTPTAALGFHNRNNWYGDGGIFDRPQVIGVGERGREAVVPLQGRGIGMLAEAIQAAMGQMSYGGRSTTYGPITVKANDPREMERQLDRQRKLRQLVSLGIRMP